MKKLILCCLCLSPLFPLLSDNQTDTLSPVLPGDSLPFSLTLEVAPFTLPVGIQAFASGVWEGKWVFLAGRTNGLHDFAPVGNNFPPLYQNRVVYLVDPKTGESWSRSLTDPSSGLTQDQIDDLSATATEFFQKGETLYVVGGYGINTGTGDMETKPRLTAINLEKLTSWVIKGHPSAKKAIRQVTDPFLQVTGGSLFQDNDHEPFLLMLGQNFVGLYQGDTNGIYTQQIRPFWIVDDGKNLSILPKVSSTTYPDWRRRDLNIVPIMRDNQPAYTAFAGVFTLTTGVWTVPITIFPNGTSYEPSPSDPSTFKQAMNHYNCPAFGLYSTKSKDMYVVFPGGISFGYFNGPTFETDAEIPFINQVTTIKIDKEENYTQYLMGSGYPFIASTGSNPGNELLFGAEAQFFPADEVPLFRNGVLQLDRLPKEETLIGYIVGGIMSTLPNTNGPSDSTASPYVFLVKYIPEN